MNCVDMSAGQGIEVGTPERERILADFFESTLSGYWDWNIPARTVHIGPAFKKMLGYDDSELPNSPDILEMMTFPDDLPGMREAFDRHIQSRGQVPYHNEVRYRHRDGSTVWCIRAGRVIEWGGDGTPIRMVGCHVDISDRKRAEAALARSLEVLRDAGRMAHVGGWSLDGTTRELTWTEEVYHIHEVEADFGLDLARALEFFPPSSQIVIRAAVDAAIERGESFDLELEIITARGVPRSVHVIGRVERHEGRTTRIRGTVQDITDQRQWQDRIRHSETMDAIGELASGVAHDFNNQLTGILGYAEMLSERVADPAVHRYASRIKTAAMRAADLTRQLLAFSRKGRYVTVPVDVHKVVSEVVAFLEHSIDKRISVQQDLRARPHFVLGDPTQLQSALLNLALNARDAMPQGGDLVFATSVVTLSADPSNPELEPGAYVQVRITDTGTGMDAQTMRHLFDPFFTTKEQGRGTGLGLAAVHGAVKSHRGTICVASQIGKGTTFSVCLPALERSATGHETESRAIRGEARILVIDDEPLTRDLVADILTALGYQVTACDNGVEAIEWYRRSWQQVDLVIVDMVMPHLCGRDTFMALRRVNPDAKVLLVSGHGLDGEVQGTLDDGALGFVQKPFTQAELSRKVAEALG